MIDDVVCLFWRVVNATPDGDDRYHVDESRTIFAIIYDADLALLVSDDVLAKMGNGVLCGVDTILTALDVTAGSLEEATVAADNLVLVVAGKFVKCRGGIDWNGGR